MRALDLGSGHNPVEQSGWATPGDVADFEFVNMDLYDERANCKYDFNETPYPFPDDHFDAVFARHSLEHVRRDRFIEVMREIHRISKDGALFYIRVPNWNSPAALAGDPTHWNLFNEATFQLFCQSPLAEQDYIPRLFEMVSIDHRFHPKVRLIPRVVLRELMHLLNGVCDELWVVLRLVKSNGRIPYRPPKRTFHFNPMKREDRKAAAVYGAMFWGVLALFGLTFLDLVGLV